MNAESAEKNIFARIFFKNPCSSAFISVQKIKCQVARKNTARFLKSRMIEPFHTLQRNFIEIHP
jgi:uncharacterized protein (DUF488 family)